MRVASAQGNDRCNSRATSLVLEPFDVNFEGWPFLEVFAVHDERVKLVVLSPHVLQYKPHEDIGKHLVDAVVQQ